MSEQGSSRIVIVLLLVIVSLFICILCVINNNNVIYVPDNLHFDGKLNLEVRVVEPEEAISPNPKSNPLDRFRGFDHLNIVPLGGK